MTEPNPHFLEPTSEPISLSDEEQLFNAYYERVSGFPGFRQRAFAEAHDDFVATEHAAIDGLSPEIFRPVINRIIRPESYERFKSELSQYWQEYDLESGLDNRSYCILTNHRFFSDLPVAMAEVRDMRDHDPAAASRNVLVVGKMIPTMEVDINGDGNFAAVTTFLSMGGRQLQSVPGLSADATKEMRVLANNWNGDFKAAFHKYASMPGYIILEAGSGTHDQPSPDGRQLVMKRVNAETARLMLNPILTIIPIFFSCDSFAPEGLVPAEANYQLLPPRSFQTINDLHRTMAEIAQAGSELLADEFPDGVVYPDPLRKRRTRELGRRAVK
jgi:hypothetical protein